MSRHDRSPSPRPHKKRRRSPERSVSPERISLASIGAKEIDESDYFQKSEEFRVWLKDEKGKYFDELSGEKARSYFKKFVKAWNRGLLPKSLYAGVKSTSIASSSQTAYKWGFAAKASRAEKAALEAAREEVGAATYLDGNPPSRVLGPAMPPGGRVAGPTLPSASDLQLAREAEEEQTSAQRAYAKGVDKRAHRERVEEAVGPREVGREGQLEKKRVKREGDRSFREAKEDAGLEVREDVLMGAGGGDSFRERIRQRDAARARFEEKRQMGRMADTGAQERAQAMKEKENATMEMFKKLAKERFGGG